MLRPALALSLLFALGTAAPAQAADPLEGNWLTARNDNGNSGLIQIAPCGAALCGTLMHSYGPDGKEMESDNVGRQIIWDTEPRGNGLYRGKLYAPDRDKTYNSKLVLTQGDRLSVSGCFLGICREGGVWQKQ